MQIETAQDRVLTALVAHYPGTRPVLDMLNAARPGHPAFVFRADLGDGRSVIAKLTTPALLAPYATRLIAVHPFMAEGRFRVPEPLLYLDAMGLLLMEDSWGMQADALLLQGDAAAERALQAGAGWIARFHAISQARTGFNPDPHINWLEKSIALHDREERLIPDIADLRAHLPELRRMAEAARGAMVRRAITHRDFHLRNLMIRKQGRVFGIDFENGLRDETLRDLLSFLVDSAKVRQQDPSASNLHLAARQMRLAYGREPAAQPVRVFFQRCFALAGWAALDEAAPTGPKRRRTLAVMQMLAPRQSKRFADKLNCLYQSALNSDIRDASHWNIS
jgi:Phosphotransferase enzyme family